MIIGTLMMLASIAMFSFPKELHGHREKPSSNSTNVNKTSDPPALTEEKPKLKGIFLQFQFYVGTELVL